MSRKIDELNKAIDLYEKNNSDSALKYYNQQADQSLKQANQSLNAKYSNSNEYANNQVNYNANMSNYQEATSAVEKLRQAIEENERNSIQLNNANEQAQKYTGTQLKAQGMGNVGQSQYNYNAVNNQYLNNVANNRSQYTQTVQDIINKYTSNVASNNQYAQQQISQNNYNYMQEQDEATKNAFIEEMYDTQDIDDLDYIWNERGYADDVSTTREYKTLRNRLLSQQTLSSLQSATSSVQVDDIMSTLGDMDGMLPSTKKALKQAASQKNALLAGWDGESSSIDLKYADIYSFGEYKGLGARGKQDSYIRTVLNYLSKQDNAGNYKNNGCYIDMNYGYGDEDYYYFRDGYLYKVNSVPRGKIVIQNDNYSKYFKK